MKKLLTRKEYEEFVLTLPDDVCPFCDVDRQILLGSSKHWYWVANLSPYWRYHTLLVPKKHKKGITDLTLREFSDLESFYQRITDHLMALELRHTDGMPVDQFIFMVRTRRDGVEGGSTYHKPEHLHIHISPDREGVERFVLDDSASGIDIEAIALPTR